MDFKSGCSVALGNESYIQFMKKLFPSIITLLLVLSKSIGQPAARVPLDLTVTAEIVHAVRLPERLVNTTQYIPYLRLSIRNQTTHARNVNFMSCSWYDSWTQKGAYRLCGDWLCEKNTPESITIPAGKALVFYGLMCARQNRESKTGDFLMGFIDYAPSYFRPLPIKEGEQKKRKPSSVYWSNKLNGRIDITHTPEIIAPHLKQSYSLEAGK